MAWMFYYQSEDESDWKVSEVKYREEVLKLNPPFTTILDLNQIIRDDMTSEDLANISYQGPLYFDFDSDDIKFVIPPFQEFLEKLESKGVNLYQCQIYATGGKGFHLTIPMEVFIPKVTGRGFKFLPLIYKEMAWDLAVDTMDMRVYSARRGRMFRTANVRRTNGKYKVPITPHEAKTMTTESYDLLTSAPRRIELPDEPEFNSDLATLFTVSSEKVNKSRTKKRSKTDAELISKFNGKFPPTFESIARGENLHEDAGFQQIATQLAITAVALGKSESELLEACEGLIKNHQSDGYRYNTEDKRRRELIRMHTYMSDNPCYDFSAGGLINLLEDKSKANDLDIPPVADEGIDTSNSDEWEELGLSQEVVRGVFYNRTGIHVKKFNNKEDCWEVKQICTVGIENEIKIEAINEDTNSFEPRGYEFSVYVDNQYKGRGDIQEGAFGSSNLFHQRFSTKFGGSFQGSDQEARAMLDIMRARAKLRGKIQVGLPREGLDVIKIPDPSNPDGYRVKSFYVSLGEDGVIPEDDVYDFRFDGSGQSTSKTNLLKSRNLTDDPRPRTFFDNFFNLYPESILSRALGYFIACHLNQVLRYHFQKFPSLQIYGQAGTGKSEIASILSYLHTYNSTIPLMTADSTGYAIRESLSNSASIPVMLDEYKPSEFSLQKASELRQIIRNNYTGNANARGTRKLIGGDSQIVVDNRKNSAPLIYISEQLEDQKAIVDRAVILSMNPRNTGNSKISEEERNRFYFVKGELKRGYLGAWGLLIVNSILSTDSNEFVKTVEKYVQMVSRELVGPAEERPIYNTAVVLTGLELGAKSLRIIFGDRYDLKMEDFKNYILNNLRESIPLNKSESLRVLDTLAYLSITNDIETQLQENFHYVEYACPDTGKYFLDLELKGCWNYYSRYRRSQGERPLYNNEGSFIAGIKSHPCAVKGSYVSSLGPSSSVARLDIQRLYEEYSMDSFRNMEAEKF